MPDLDIDLLKGFLSVWPVLEYTKTDRKKFRIGDFVERCECCSIAGGNAADQISDVIGLHSTDPRHSSFIETGDFERQGRGQ
jgi:hypothetical protein